MLLALTVHASDVNRTQKPGLVLSYLTRQTRDPFQDEMDPVVADRSQSPEPGTPVG